MEAVEHLAHHSHELEVLSAKTGLSTTALQEFSVAFKLTGTSAEDVGKLLPKMEKALVAGSEAFHALGLSAKKLKDEKPEQAFQEIAERIREIRNPTEQAAAAIAIFGKSGASALPAIKFGLTESAEAAHHLGAVMSEETIRAAAELAEEAKKQGMAWEALKNNLASVVTDNEGLRAAFHAMTEAIAAASRFALEHKATLGVLGEQFVILGKQVGAIAAAFGGPLVGAFRSVLGPIDEIAKRIDQFKREHPYIYAALGQTGEGMLRSAAGLVAGELGVLAAGRVPDAISGMAHAEREARLYPGASISNERAGGRGAGFDPEAAKAAAAAQKKIADEWDSFMKRHMKAEDEAIEHLKKEGRLALYEMENEAEKFNREQAIRGVEEWLKANKAANEKMFQDWSEAIQRQEAAREAAARHRDAILSLGAAIAGLGGQFGGVFGTILNLGAAGIEIFERLQVKADTGTKKLAAAANAIQVAAGIMQGPGGAKGALSGAASGAAAGAAFGGIGAVIGGVAGGLLGFFSGGEGKKVNDLRDQFIAASGGLAALGQRAAEAGKTLDELLRANRVSDFEAAVKHLTDSFDLQKQAQQDLEAAAQKYGLTLAEMGPKFAQGALDQQAAQLLKEYRLLTEAGADHSAVIAKMGPAFNDYVNQARSAGVSIPENLRKVVEELIAQGKLLDENGNAFTSVEQAGLSFTETLTEGLSKAVDAINRLVDAMLGVNRAAGAFPGIPGVPGGTGPGPRSPSGFDAMGRGGIVPGHVLPFIPRAARGLMVPPTRGGRAFVAGEGGEPELIAPVTALAKAIGRAAAEASGGGALEVHVHIGGEQLVPVLVRYKKAGYLD